MTVTRVRRTFAATPVRSAAATWGAIVDTIAPLGANERATLTSATGVAASLIAAEAWGATPVIVSGVGPQLRIYCSYGEDAILGEDTNEESLSWAPTEGDWRIEMPCPPEDLEWVKAALADCSARLEAVDMTTKRGSATLEAAASPVPTIDVEAFLRG